MRELNVDSPALAQLEDETNKAFSAFLDYVGMGAGRSLPKLWARYKGVPRPEQGRDAVPTRRLTTLKEWSSKYDWQKRVAAHLAEFAKRQADEQQERLGEFTDRVWGLYGKLADKLEELIDDYSGMRVVRRQFVKDPKDDTKQMQVVYMAPNTADWKRLIDAFGRLGTDLRRQLGLPEQVDVTSAGVQIQSWPTLVTVIAPEEHPDDES